MTNQEFLPFFLSAKESQDAGALLSSNLPQPRYFSVNKLSLRGGEAQTDILGLPATDPPPKQSHRRRQNTLHLIRGGGLLRGINSMSE